MDAARAAWIGGTRLLFYGELLPAGTEKALAVMAPGLHFLPEGAPGRHHEVALELGMGRGRCALHLFLAGCTVLGVELAGERYSRAAEIMERLAHRCPDIFRVSFQVAKARLSRKDSPQHSFYEARLGNFFDVTPAEMAAATLIFLQVSIPAVTWPTLRRFLEACSPGCRVLSFEDFREVWHGVEPFPWRDIGAPVLACSWEETGHRFHCYERLDLEEEARLLQRCGVAVSHGSKKRARGLRHVKLHLTMKHPHICELLEYFDEPSTVTLILEYCRGGDLFDAIVAQSKNTGRGFTEKQAIIATRHVLSALEYLHRQKVVHRDIKCENILLKHTNLPVEENIFKLCDFGFAAHDSGEGLGDRLGSPDTVAPEIVVGTRYSTPVDMWSAGVLVYMMLSATPPFYATTDSEVLRKVRTGSYSLSGEPWDSLPGPPKELIASLMTVDPKKRPTAQQALNCSWLKE
ncbi:unnamed protein product [Effrenium voratum]|nr:unnamed protein product [Effrenium voratum]